MSTRKINVIDAVEVHSGTSASGSEWKLYEITATTEAGDPIELKLKSFTKLSGLVEVEVEEQNHEKYGKSYLLKTPGKGGGSPGARLGPKVDELRGRIERLESGVANLESEIAGLKQLVAEGPNERQYGHPPEGARNALFDDDPSDIPF